MTVALVRPGTLYAWNGPSLLITGTRGECGEDQPLSGFYFREARFVRTLRFEIDGDRPWLCEATAVDPRTLAFVYTHPEVAEYGGGGTGQAGDTMPENARGLIQRALAMRLRYVIKPGGLIVRLSITNHSSRRTACDLFWHVEADFADIQEAQSGRREQNGTVERATTATSLTFTYAHPGLRYRAALTPAGPGPWTIDRSGIGTHVDLRPQESIELSLRVDPSDADGAPLAGDFDERDRLVDEWRAGFAHLSAPGELVPVRIVEANIADCASFPLLEGEQDEWLALQAGMPLYPALFGRDSLTAGWQAAWVDGGRTLEATLTRLGRMQSDRVDDWRDEQPGRIPYQVRRGPLAILNINPYSAYYADCVSPLMFVIALGHLYAWNGDAAVVRRHWKTASRIMDWAREYGDPDGDGYLEYQTRSSKGTKNQGWKDSGDAIIYEDGTPVPPPHGTCELQGYWFAAQQLMAVLSWAIGERRLARAYWRSAAALKRRFNRDWWIDDDRSIALALDPQKRQVPAVSSNIAHCIAAGIVSDEHLPAAVERLFARDMFSGWGIRTLSSAHGSYNPLSYHCGTVWAVEQATLAFGLRRFGFDARALELAAAMFELAARYPDWRIPECIGGYQRDDRSAPGAYPHANAPQLWNASAFSLLVHTILGLQPVAPLNTLVVAPALPPWMPEVAVTGMRLGKTTATIRFWRDDGGRSHAKVLESDGPLHLIHQQPPESLAAGPWDRFRALIQRTIR